MPDSIRSGLAKRLLEAVPPKRRARNAEYSMRKCPTREDRVARIRVGILGATGLVGQRLVERLAAHPTLALQALAASERSAGKTFREAAQWTLSSDPPL